MKYISFLILTLLLPTIAAAEDDPKFLDLGGDLYGGGSSVLVNDTQATDVFLGGQDTTLSAPISGSAHMVGQTVTVSMPVAGNAYAAGQTVTFTAPVSGSATLAGQTVTVQDVGRNLRAFGQTVSVNGDIGGSAMIAAQTARIDGTVAGDVAVNASAIQFGPSAEVAGTLTIYHADPDSINVPATVAPAERITRKSIEEWSADAPTSISLRRETIWSGVISTVITITVLAAILAALMPNRLSETRATFLERPLRSFWFGFLTLSAAIGTTIVLAMTLIGLLAVPLSVLLAIALGFAGYIVGSYALGVGLLVLLGRDAPGAWIERALAAATGAVIIAAVGLVPFLGWLVVLAITLTGLGALCIVFFRPRFYAEVSQPS